MRIAYGVFGYGHGHATRAAAVLPMLERRNDVFVMAGGTAYEELSATRPVHRLPDIRYVYHDNSPRRSLLGTVVQNFGTATDAFLRGPALTSAMRALRNFDPHVAICDCDPFAHHAAARLGIPRISFDHFGVIAFCDVPMPWDDRVRAIRDVGAYRAFIRNPDRVVVSSFFPARPLRRDVVVVGPLVREAVKRAAPTRGDHLLCYFNNGAYQLTPRIEEALHALRMPVIVYGTPRSGQDGRLLFKAKASDSFIADLASSVAVLSTAGNQLVGEALHLRKPMLVTPEDTVEQRVNAAAIERIGFGRGLAHHQITVAVIRRFLSELPHYRENGRRYAVDGTPRAFDALMRFASQLAHDNRRRTSIRSVEFA
jgi:uncharacterized protein (TIGR00661 family)